jgi:hypothetical protein
MVGASDLFHPSPATHFKTLPTYYVQEIPSSSFAFFELRKSSGGNASGGQSQWRYNVWVCGHSLAGIAVSNSAGSMDIFLFQMLCVVSNSSLSRADHSHRGILHSMVSLSVIVKPQ